MAQGFKHITQVRVRYGETDQMGYCYYGNYAQYFEVGRVETMRTLGCSYKKLEADGIMLPVSDFQVKYFRPALYDDLLSIKTEIVELRGPRIVFDYEITNEKNEIISKASTTLVFVKKETMRPTSPPSYFETLLQKSQANVKS
ncbi:MAG: acyl-CoA thioesterase [Bacteroidetes bacterium]|nr:acyl-CoA thioesterase [Bacteroidota bacterium]